MSDQPHHIEATEAGALARVFKSELNSQDADAITQDFRKSFAESGTIGFTIDMAQVEYIDSAVVGSLVTFLIDTQHNARQLTLANCQPRVRTLIKVTGLDTHINLTDAINPIAA